MISRRDINEITGSARESIIPANARPVDKNTRPAENSFDMILKKSFKEIEEKEILFKKDLFGSSGFFTQFNGFGLTGIDDRSDFKKILQTVLQYEGNAYVKNDGGRQPSKFGILQSTAREFGYRGDIKYISLPEAEAIYKKIWDRSGAESLPYPLSLIHFDTYVNSPGAARKFLRKSGGNVEAYLEMRAQRYSRLARLRPERFGKYLTGWMDRVSSLRNIAAEYMLARNLSEGQKRIDES